MRAFVCTDFENERRNLVWLTEYNTGVSVGLYDGDADPHATYHTDGTFHHKVRSRGTRFCISGSQSKPPLSKIPEEEQLLNTCVFYSKDIMSRHTKFKPDPRTSVVVVLPHSLFLGNNAIALNSSIINRTHEEVFIQHAYDSHRDGSFKLVAIHVFALDLFPNHKVGLVVYTGKK